MVKRDNGSGNYAIFMFQSDLEFPKTERNGKLPMEFWKCDIADKVCILKIHTFG